MPENIITDDLTVDLNFIAIDPNEYPMVQIRWNDTVYKSGWLTEDELANIKEDALLEITSVGYLIYRSDDRVILALSVCNDNNQTGDHIVIPESVVLDIKELEIKQDDSKLD